MKTWRILFCCAVLVGSGETSFSQTHGAALDNFATPLSRSANSLSDTERPEHTDWIDTIPLPEIVAAPGPTLSDKFPSSPQETSPVQEHTPSTNTTQASTLVQGQEKTWDPSSQIELSPTIEQGASDGASRFTFLYPASESSPTASRFLAHLALWKPLFPTMAGEPMDPKPYREHAPYFFLRRYGSLFHPDWEPPARSPHSYGHIEIILNRHVARNLAYFHDIIPERFQTYLNRFEPYKGMVQQIFREFGLPQELAYLSLVESGFNPRAYSRARAVGPWQFMKGTGRLYGLRINWYVDERRDPLKSTVAAAHHLRDLYDQFRSWPLALAAYNAGSGKISRAVRRSGSRDFWKIRRTWYIRRETKEYVPRFMAATLIAENPEDYGFSVAPVPPHQFDEVVIDKRIHLKSIAKHTGIPYEELQRLNPELRRNIIPARAEGYYLKIPVGTRLLVESRREAFEPWTQPPPPPTKWYRVRWGDSLSVVAKRFGMSVRALKKLNNLSHNLIRVGQRLRVRAEEPPIDPNKASWYIVRYGDSLSTIAQRFGTTVAQLKRLNHLRGHVIHPGDRLRVRAPSQGRTGEAKWYRVRPGDSLWSIAKRFSISVMDLKILNNLTSSVIRAGRLLLVSH